MGANLPNKIIFKKAWDDEPREESKGWGDFDRAQKFSEQFLMKNSADSGMKAPSKIQLPKIVENSSKNIFICNEEDEKMEEKKHQESAEKLRLSEVPLQEESEEQIISGENLDQVVSLSTRKSLVKKVLPKSESPFRRSRTRDALKKRKILRKRIIFSSQQESDRLESSQDLLSERQHNDQPIENQAEASPPHISKNSDDSNFTNEDVEHLLA